jgi:hypothetical protein
MGRATVVALGAASLGVCLALAASSCHGSSTRPQANGNNSAVAVVATGGRTKAYVFYGPSNDPNAVPVTGQLAVVDVGVAGNGIAGAPAQLKLLDLGPADFGLSVTGTEDLVLAAGVTEGQVFFVDPRSDTITGKVTLDSSYLRYKVSDREMVIGGIQLDATTSRAYLSVWNGVAVVDTGSRQVIANWQAPPSENLAFDAGRGWLFLPYTDCRNSLFTPPPGWNDFCDGFRTPGGTVILDGLNLVDVRTGAVYAYQNPTSPGPDAPAGLDPDGTAVDAATGLAVVVPEGGGDMYGLDLNHAVLQQGSRSFTAPRSAVPNPAAIAALTPLQAISLSRNGQYLFLLHEVDSVVGFGPGAPLRGGSGRMLLGTMPNLPGPTGPLSGDPWINRGDPHGLTMATVNGRECVILVNNVQTWIARIDLATLLSLPHADPGLLTADEMAPAITYLDMTTPPP